MLAEPRRRRICEVGPDRRVDQAPPAPATASSLPIIQASTGPAGLKVERRDTSLAGRILANFGDFLTADQQVADALAELGQLAKLREANIIKLITGSPLDPASCLRLVVGAARTGGAAVVRARRVGGVGVRRHGQV